MKKNTLSMGDELLTQMFNKEGEEEEERQVAVGDYRERRTKKEELEEASLLLKASVIFAY